MSYMSQQVLAVMVAPPQLLSVTLEPTVLLLMFRLLKVTQLFTAYVLPWAAVVEVPPLVRAQAPLVLPQQQQQ
jgi:hypothetical protein